MKIGLISDTHGLMRDQALAALSGVELILHAGDVGGDEVLQALAEVAPVRAVRGNMDGGGWSSSLPVTDAVDLEGQILYMLHDVSQLDLVPAAADISVVISGHTHLPTVYWRDGVLYINPGSAGARRHNKPVSVGILDLTEARLEARILVLEP